LATVAAVLIGAATAFGVPVGGASVASTLAVGASGGETPPAATAAAAAGTWTEQPAAVVSAPSGDGDLDSISCPTSTLCVAVGDYQAASGYEKALIDVRRGTSGFTRMPAVPLPTAAYSQLTSVSCANAHTCVAVGYFTGATTPAEYTRLGTRSRLTRPFAEHWNGTSWRMRLLPTPDPTRDETLASVSCPASNLCLAVGTVGSARPRAFALRWHNGAWGVPSQGSNISDTRLNAVSCPRVGFCIAVGERGSSTTFVRRWTDGRWTNVAAAAFRPPGTYNTKLTGVSCTSPTECWAIGSRPKGPRPLIVEHLHGTHWSINGSAAALPSGLPGPIDTFGLSCASITSCTGLVGDTFPTHHVAVAVLARGRWTIRTLAVHGVALRYTLSGVSCRPAGCELVGTSDIPNSPGPARALRYVPGHLTTQTAATPPTVDDTHLNAVSCQPDASCVAVGTQNFGLTPVGPTAVIETRTDGRWHIVTSATNQPNGNLTSVSCPTTTFCMATGYHNGPSATPFAAMMSGDSWTFQPLQISVHQVSCPTASFCMAIGTDAGVAAEKWTDTGGWSAPLPLPTQPAYALNSVSCSSATDCLAVGHDNVSLHWDGSSWAEVGDTAQAADSVSCVSPTFCMILESHDSITAETWDGTDFHTVAVPPHVGLLVDNVTGVSCTSTTACTLAGTSSVYAYYDGLDEGYTRTLVETWNGTSWTVQDTPNETGGDNNLTGISCTSAGCTAVGTLQRQIGIPFAVHD
jgi:hypothetical protein